MDGCLGFAPARKTKFIPFSLFFFSGFFIIYVFFFLIYILYKIRKTEQVSLSIAPDPDLDPDPDPDTGTDMGYGDMGSEVRRESGKKRINNKKRKTRHNK